MSKNLKVLEKKTKSCNLYSYNSCGGLKGKITNNKQCIYYSICKEITIDNNYQYFDTDNFCNKKTGVTFDEVKNICIMDEDETECKLHTLICNDYSEYNTDLTKCYYLEETCHKIKIIETNSLKGKNITISSDKYDINDDGECKTKEGKTLENYEKCSYNSDYTKCELINKDCSEMELTECFDCKASQSGFKCWKVDYNSINCENIVIDSQCKIDSEGGCIKASETEDKNTFHFIETDSKCQYYEVDSLCKITFTGAKVDCEGDNLTD